jgi:hypothetical protein
MNTWDAVLASAPINGTAASVVAQSRAPASQGDMGPDEIKAIIDRLVRKQRLLKRVLGISSKAQHKNLMYRMNSVRRAVGVTRFQGNPRSAVEYKRLGIEINRLNARVCELRKEPA